MNIKLKPTVVITMMIPLLGMPLALPTAAAEGDKASEQSLAAAKAFRLMRASQLIGKNVEIHYAVLEFDQSWNLNDKLISLPLRAFNYVASDQDLILNIDKESIDTRRAYQKDRWPEINDQNYRVETDRYLGTLAKSSTAPGPEALFTRVDSDNDVVIRRSDANTDPSVKKKLGKNSIKTGMGLSAA